MKAMNFLELNLHYRTLNYGESENLADELADCGIDNFENFYSREFEPDLISIYFKGWELVDIRGNEFAKNPQLFITIYLKKQPNNKYAIDINGEINYSPYPRTLDDFINDCQRAGIELKFKNQ